MIRFLPAVLLSIGSLLFSHREQEVEPNGNIATATQTGPLPSGYPHSVYGELASYDTDLWKVNLWYPTSFLIEGEAFFRLTVDGPAQLVLLQAEKSGGVTTYSFIGSWQAANGVIETGSVPITYYWKGWDHLIAIVDTPTVRPVGYTLTYW